MSDNKKAVTGPESGTMIRDLTTGSVWKQLIKFATPLFISSLLQVVYSTVDMIVVGQFHGSQGLAAVNIGSEVGTLMAFVAMGMCTAGQVIISQYVGAGQREKISRLIGTMFTVLVAAALTLSTLCLIFCNNIMHWINTPPEIYDEAKKYVLTCVFGLVFINGYHLISSILRGMGDSRRPMMFIAVASVINVILDLILVGVFHMGAFGAALATVISQSISFFWALIYLYRRKEQFGFDFKLKSFRVDKESLKPLIRLGVPMMIQFAAINFARLFTASWINTYGTIIIAVSGIGNKLQTVAMLFSQALTTAGSTMIAQCIGGEKYKRVPRIIWACGVITVAFTAAMSLITIIAPDFVFGLFVNDTEVLRSARVLGYIPVVVMLMLSCGLRSPFFGLINGSGNSKLNLAVALVDGVVGRIGLCLLLGVALDLGIGGFWYGEALAGLIPIVIGVIYYISGKWRTRKYLFKE